MALLKRWLDEAGLTTRFDAVGNLWGRAEGTDGGSAVVTGSHVDTVRQGGKYDGALGVHMAIAAVQALLERRGRHETAAGGAGYLRGGGQQVRLLLLGGQGDRRTGAAGGDGADRRR